MDNFKMAEATELESVSDAAGCAYDRDLIDAGFTPEELRTNDFAHLLLTAWTSLLEEDIE